MGKTKEIYLILAFDSASAFGDPHFVTFDGVSFSFSGNGEYVLLETTLSDLRVQGRAQPGRMPNGEAGPHGLYVGGGGTAGSSRVVDKSPIVNPPPRHPGPWHRADCSGRPRRQLRCDRGAVSWRDSGLGSVAESESTQFH